MTDECDSTPDPTSRVYQAAAAAAATGKSVDELRRMAIGVFASILHHVLERPGVTIWTAAWLDPKLAKLAESALNVEVDLPRRLRQALAAGAGAEKSPPPAPASYADGESEGS